MSETGTVHVDVEPPADEPEDHSTVVIVNDDGGASDAPSDDEITRAVDTEHRFGEIERRLSEVESRSWSSATHEEVAAIAEAAADDAVADAAVVADQVAADTASEVAEETATEVVEDVTPHKTHWLHRSWAEWMGKSGSGKVD